MGWLAKLAGFAIPSWGMYAMLAGAFVAWGGYTAYLMHEYDEGRYAAAATDRAVLAAVQKSQTDAQILAWKRLYEATNDKAKKLEEIRKLDIALADKRVRDALSKAGAGRRIVPPAASSSASDKRICFPDRDALDREISAGIAGAFGRYAPKRIASAEEGQHAADVAVLCRDWTKAISQP